MNHELTKVGVISLGCPRNLVDSEVMMGLLRGKGYKLVDIEDADVALVNTCAFIEDAKKESIDIILDLVNLKKQGQIKAIIVAGCLPQRYKGLLRKDIKEIDALLGVNDIENITNAIERIKEKKDFFNSGFKARAHLPRASLTPGHFVYLKISEGCINRCSYCIIPDIRGPLRSRPVESVVKELGEVSRRRKIGEVNIVSQDTTLYGLDLYGSAKITDLVKKIAAMKRFHWIRLLYNHPAHISGALIRLIKDEEAVCKYIDMPIQHISDNILAAMNRKIAKKQIVSLIGRLRKEIPDVALRTALIVGFPGETDKDFRELYNFVKEAKFERLGVFKYSREEDTPAYKMKNHIPEKEKDRRLKEIMVLQQDISREINKKFLGKTIEALIDEPPQGKDKFYIARSQYDAPEVDGIVYVKSKEKLKPGDFVGVKITDFYEYDLVGEIVEND